MKKEEIIKKLQNDIALVESSDYSRYPVIEFILNMDSMACYTIFGEGNDDFQSVENLTSALINGLFDDSQMNFIKQGGEYRIRICHDHEKQLSPEEVLEVAEAVQVGYDYYNEYEHQIETSNAHSSWNREWRRLEKVGEDTMRKCGWDDSDSTKAMRKRMQEMFERLHKDN